MRRWLDGCPFVLQRVSGPRSSVLLVGGDLNARVRAEAACRAAGRELRHTTSDGLTRALAEPPALVFVDLDEGGREVLEALTTERDSGTLDPTKVVIYFSHVDEDAGKAARAAGFRSLPRGRFWRELPSLVVEV